MKCNKTECTIENAVAYLKDNGTWGYEMVTAPLKECKQHIMDFKMFNGKKARICKVWVSKISGLVRGELKK